MLVPRDRIAALSTLARDPTLSAVADRTRDLPVTAADMERVAALDPDLVLAGPHGAAPAIALMRSRGVPVVRIGLARGFDDIREHIRTIAAAVGEPEAGAGLIGRLDATLAGLPRTPGRKPAALVLGANGFTAGEGTLTDAVLKAAGLGNAAGGFAGGYGFVALERIAASPPDVLILESVPDDHPSLAHALLHHPVLRALPSARLDLDRAAVTCGGPFTAEAAARLAEAVRR